MAHDLHSSDPVQLCAQAQRRAAEEERARREAEAEERLRLEAEQEEALRREEAEASERRRKRAEEEEAAWLRHDEEQKAAAAAAAAAAIAGMSLLHPSLLRQCIRQRVMVPLTRHGQHLLLRLATLPIEVGNFACC